MIINKIKLFVCDNDGVLTDGGFYTGPNGEITKKFNTRDFTGFWLLRQANVKVACVTGCVSTCVPERFKFAAPGSIVVSGSKNKVDDVLKIMNDLGIEQWSEVAFVGDEYYEVDILKRVGHPACPADACSEVRSLVEEIGGIVLDKKGGDGCVREFIDHLRATGLVPDPLAV